MTTPVYTLDPLRDDRWPKFVGTHPAASVFHTSEWSKAVHRTYGHQPVVYTTSPPGEDVANGIIFCRVRSWLTGHRHVSVPFADHCDPLVEQGGGRAAILGALVESRERFELRPQRSAGWDTPPLMASARFLYHQLDLRRELSELFRATHRDTVQRRVERADRAGVTYERGRGARELEAFYRLQLITRQRHGVPPQPLRWFSNLLECMGARASIGLAWKDGQAVAAIFTLQHRLTMVYKYGCSDASFHRYGTMPFLFWQTIVAARSAGCELLDLGRSDLDNIGLIAFKERLGGLPSSLIYYGVPGSKRTAPRPRARRFMSRLPLPLLTAVGKALYPHLD